MKMENCCCERLLLALEKNDSPVIYVRKFREYGIRVNDGGSSFIQIEFCPFCGTRLPSSLRDEWFEALAEMGFEPDSINVPDSYLSDHWWRGEEAD